MKLSTLTLLLAWSPILGCAGRINADLLQARIREQASQLTETQREFAKTRTELKHSRDETDRLKSELARMSHAGDAVPQPMAKISKIHIHPLASGGLNKDDQSGDDVVVVQFVPYDQDNEPIKTPGDLEFVLLDPSLPENEREIGRWKFSADECRRHWTRGIAGSGFQFSLPLDHPPQHTDVVVHLKFRTAEDRQFDVSQVVKVVAAPGNTVGRSKRSRPGPVQVVAEADEALPPVGEPHGQIEDADAADWARDDEEPADRTAGHTMLHSANWTEATIPRLR